LGVYELSRVELLRDVFVWAYDRSAKRYVAVRQSLGEPDKFRLKFQNELTEVVGNIVRGGLALTVEAVTRVAREHVPAEHLDDFVRMTINDLEHLHEANFARFRHNLRSFMPGARCKGVQTNIAANSLVST
jgi:hypothetical protein